MPSRGGRGQMSPAQTGIGWTLGTRSGWGFEQQLPSNGSQSWRSGELEDGYKDSSEATLSDRSVRR